MSLVLIEENKFNVDVLTSKEAHIMCLFLFSEKLRHIKDVNDIVKIIEHLEKKFDFNTYKEYNYGLSKETT